MIRSKSLHKANVAFLLDPRVPVPENAVFTSLFRGVEAQGINFMDDPIIQTKVLSVPKAGLQVVWEGRRLRIEDNAALPPEDSRLPHRAREIFQKLFGEQKNALTGFGFNFDVYYQMRDVIRIDELFRRMAPAPSEFGTGLMDFGWQWTVQRKDGKRLDGYFVKVTAPLELVMHHNPHFNQGTLPTEAEFVSLFADAYRSLDAVVENFDL